MLESYFLHWNLMHIDIWSHCQMNEIPCLKLELTCFKLQVSMFKITELTCCLNMILYWDYSKGVLLYLQENKWESIAAQNYHFADVFVRKNFVWGNDVETMFLLLKVCKMTPFCIERSKCKKKKIHFNASMAFFMQFWFRLGKIQE